MSENPGRSTEPQHSHPHDPYQPGQYSGGYTPAPPPAYAGYGYNQTAADANNAATLALVLGILGVVVLPILAPFAIWQANKAERLGKPATAGKVLGWIGVAFLVIGLLAVLVLFIGLMAGFSAGVY